MGSLYSSPSLIYIFWLVAEILVFFLIVYTVYKVIWYFVKMRALFVMLKKSGDKITLKRSFFGMIFAPKGAPLCEITTPDGVVEVGLLSFISVHGRWNIEKATDGYYAEARRSQKMFYKVYNHAEQPWHAIDYRRENRFRRCPLALSPMDSCYAGQILLVYPRPIVALTLAMSSLDEISSGHILEGHEILFAEEFVERFINT